MRKAILILLVCLPVLSCSMGDKNIYRQGYRAGMKSALEDFKDRMNATGPAYPPQPLSARAKAGIEVKEDPSFHSRQAFNKDMPRPENQEYEKLGNRYLAQGDYSKAFVFYTNALQHNPRRKDIRYKVAMLYLGQGLLGEARAEFEKIIKEDKSYAPAYQGMGQALLADRNRYEEAARNFQKAVSLDPSLWQAHNFLGIIYDYQRQYDKAMEAFQAAIKLKPQDGFLYNNLGVCYYLKGQYGDAVRTFREAIKLGIDSSRTYNNLGLALGELKQYDDALEAFKKGGNEAQAYNNIGCVYLKQGEYRDANRAFSKAIELAPRFYTRANNNLKLVPSASSGQAPGEVEGRTGTRNSYELPIKIKSSTEAGKWPPQVELQDDLTIDPAAKP